MLQWNPNVTLFGSGKMAAINFASIAHLVVGVLGQSAFQRYFAPIPTLIAINILHAIEDFAENLGTFSFEHIFANMIGCKTTLWLEPMDHDTMQNFIFDLLSFLLGTIIAYYGLFRSLPMSSLVFIFITFLAVYTVLCYREVDAEEP